MADDDRADRRSTRLENDTLSTPVITHAPPATTRVRARLVVLAGQQVGRKYPLDDSSTIGRGSSSTVPIDDTLVSRTHVTIQREPDGSYVLHDLGSRNGTLINGKRVQREPLRFGDRIQVGQTLFLFTHIDPLEDRILQRQKLEAIGRLGAGVAHDINNLLGAILVNTEYLESGRTSAPPLSENEISEALADVRAAAKLGADLTKRLLAFARRGTGDHAVLDYSALVNEALELAHRTFDRKVRMERDLAPSLRVRGDRGHLHQMLMNLFINARDAMPAGGVLTVTVRAASESDVAKSALPKNAEYVLLAVADTGIGMSEETRRHIFEPFFTTKSEEKGSGLGLATVLDVVTAHGGHVACESELGHGTTFSILLPVASGAMRGDTHTPLVQVALLRADHPRGTVLVVDDEAVSRRSICRLLGREGHRTLEADSGPYALEVFSQSDVDVVLMDLDLPDLDGESTFRVLRERAPAARVVFLTGYVDDARQRALEAAGAFAVLHKPCEAATLRRVVEDALGSASRSER